MENSYYFVRHEGGPVQINLSTVRVLESNKNYVKMMWPEGEYCLVRSSLSALLEQLPARDFVQIHRTYAVALRYVQKIEKDSVIIEGHEVPLSRQYYPELMKRIVLLGQQEEKEDAVREEA